MFVITSVYVYVISFVSVITPTRVFVITSVYVYVISFVSVISSPF